MGSFGAGALFVVTPQGVPAPRASYPHRPWPANWVRSSEAAPASASPQLLVPTGLVLQIAQQQIGFVWRTRSFLPPATDYRLVHRQLVFSLPTACRLQSKAYYPRFCCVRIVQTRDRHVNRNPGRLSLHAYLTSSHCPRRREAAVPGQRSEIRDQRSEPVSDF